MILKARPEKGSSSDAARVISCEWQNTQEGVTIYVVQ